jgi:hypothetical protein
MSLLEVMVAMALMAFIALIIASGIGTSVRVLTRSSIIGADIEAAVNRKHLRVWIEQASQSAFPGKAYSGLSGSATELMVEVMPLDGLFWAGEPMIATVSSSEDGTIVVRAVGSADRNRKLTLELGLSGIDAGLSISYYGRTSPDTYPRWQSEWKAEFGLPQLVKLVATGDDAKFPPLVIRPAKIYLQREMSLSSLLPPVRPSRP